MVFENFEFPRLEEGNRLGQMEVGEGVWRVCAEFVGAVGAYAVKAHQTPICRAACLAGWAGENEDISYHCGESWGSGITVVCWDLYPPHNRLGRGVFEKVKKCLNGQPWPGRLAGGFGFVGKWASALKSRLTFRAVEFTDGFRWVSDSSSPITGQ